MTDHGARVQDHRDHLFLAESGLLRQFEPHAILNLPDDPAVRHIFWSARFAVRNDPPLYFRTRCQMVVSGGESEVTAWLDLCYKKKLVLFYYWCSSFGRIPP